MQLIALGFKLIIVLTLAVNSSMALTNNSSLSQCLIPTNCFRAEWKFENINHAYKMLVDIASELPRISVIEVRDNYWHGIVRSRIFRFPDDLEILRIPGESKIQVRSASRIGLGDLGVNQNRVNKLYTKLREVV